MDLRKVKIGETLVISADFNADHWIKTIKKVEDLAKNEEDWRALERIIARLHGIVSSILIGDYSKHPDVKKVSDAKNKAVEGVEKKMKEAKKKAGW